MTEIRVNNVNCKFQLLINILTFGHCILIKGIILLGSINHSFIPDPTFQFHGRTAIIFRQPTLASVTNIFTLPFSTAVWLCCVFFSFITLVTLAVQLRVTFKHGVEQDLTEVTYSELFTFILGALCQQGKRVLIKISIYQYF